VELDLPGDRFTPQLAAAMKDVGLEEA